jgi:hypothetical protein
VQLVPFTSDPWQSFSCSLGGVEYGFSANFNDRNGVWSFDLSLKSTEAIPVAGVPILLGCDMLAPFGLGIGKMFAVDLAASPAWALSGDGLTVIPTTQMLDADAVDWSDSPPAVAFNGDLGVRVIVLYLAPGEVVPAP